MKFKNKTTGVVVEATNPEVIEQLKVNEDYEEVKEKVAAKKEEKKIEE